jgi:small-conductance mechanosensitive channel
VERILVNSKLIEDPDLVRIVSKGAQFGFQAFLAVTALGTVGIDTKPVIAGLGITGFTLGFALKDIATNSISGILLVLQRPFKKDSIIKVQNYEGKVLEVDYRYVKLQLKDDSVIHIPSYIVYSNPILVIKH